MPRTIYSVWNHAQRLYDYYEGNESTGTHAGTPPRPLATSQIGATPEQTAWRVPVGARKVGTGATARGRVASMGGLDLPGGSVLPYVAAAALAVYLWRSR